MKALLSFFSGFPISWYIIAILAGSLSVSLYVLQGKIEEIGGYKVAQESYTQALKSSQESLQKKDLSCKIDDNSIVELEVEKQKIQTSTDSITNDLQKLAIKQSAKDIVQLTIKPIKEINTDEASTTGKANILPDDGLLSDNVKRLLWKQYCTTEPTDSKCISP